MTQWPVLTTKRLILRGWTPADREALAVISADPEVMRYFPAPLTRDQSDALVDRIEAHFEEHGFSLWAVEVRGGKSFIGYTGLLAPRFEAHFTPCVEVGWRLARDSWGHGYATEAACAAVSHGFERLGLREIVSFTVPANVRSLGVMHRLGMSCDPADEFEHPSLPQGHPLRHHVLCRLDREAATAACAPKASVE